MNINSQRSTGEYTMPLSEGTEVRSCHLPTGYACCPVEIKGTSNVQVKY